MDSGNKYPSFVLFLASALLLSGGWMMASFPILIFAGLAPLFALTDRTSVTSVWEKMEWVFIALSVSFLAARHFDFSFIVSSLLLGILFTLPFIGYVWVRQTLGLRIGKISLILFWLSLEYLLVKFLPGRGIFLADSLQLQTTWIKWNFYTGYLGGSLLVLLTNFMVYHAVLSEKPFQWYTLMLALIVIALPILSGSFLDMVPVAREDMLDLYKGNSATTNVVYLARGEFVVRTSAWISTLLLLFTLVKSQTTRR